MKAVGLITEYNPLHNGHLYHLEKALSLSQADCAIAVMSGDFVQRGGPAIIDKYTRAASAVESGVNLVVELPTRFAMSSAEKFAEGGVVTLDKLGVSSICFGSENGSIKDLYLIAKYLASESDKYQLALKKELKKGLSYPAAREKALCKLNIMEESALHDILASSNNILGVEYLKAILRNAPQIEAYTYKREGFNYKDTFDSFIEKDLDVDNIDNPLSSSTALRQEIRELLINPDNEEAKNKLMENMPETSYKLIIEAIGNSCPIQVNAFDIIFNAKFLEFIKEAYFNKKLAASKLLKFEGFTENIANRLVNKWTSSMDLYTLINTIKDKSITYSAIARAIFHFILDHKKEAINNNEFEIISDSLSNESILKDLAEDVTYSSSDSIDYIRILAFDEKGAKYLSQIKKTCPIPIITKLAGYEDLLADDIYASELYKLAVHEQYGKSLVSDFTKGVYIKGKGFTGEQEI